MKKVPYVALSSLHPYTNSTVSSRLYWSTVLCSIATISIIIVYYQTSNALDYQVYYTLLQAIPTQDGCTIPQTDPWDPSITKYLNQPSPLLCKFLQYELTYLDDDGWLRINDSQMREAGYSNLICEFRCFDRKENTDDVTLDYGEWRALEGKVKPNCEFVEVRCQKRFPPVCVYVNLHNQIVPRMNPVAISNETRNNFSSNLVPSVILFVVDSVSHSNWRRNLPETLEVLKEVYSAHIFSGFTKVGDNSFPNAVAFLTGKRVQTAGYPDELPNNMSTEFYDNWPIIWKNFKLHNYTTLYAEDYPQFNLFKYLSNGFRQAPTDHYFREFIAAFSRNDLPMFRPYWLQLYGSFLHRRSTHLCYGNNPCHRLQLNYLKQYLNRYSGGQPLFALNWLTEIGHDYLNQVRIGDADLAEFFRSQSNSLKNSFLFVFSDHGHRFDPIRQSVIGRIEERMPFFAMHVPERLTELYPKINDVVRENSNKLASFWDLYITMHDILERGAAQDWSKLIDEDQQVKQWRTLSPRGMSLLRPLPARDCDAAGIPDDFCVCQREILVNVTDPKVQRAAVQLIEHVNAMLIEHSSTCARLRLDSIEHAQSFLPNLKMVLDPKVSVSFGGMKNNPTGFYINYRVTVSASPSNALFEGVLRNSIADDSFTVIGDVNRINKYGNQSICVHSAMLRKYCYCV